MTYKTTFETKARTIDVLDVALVGAVGPEGKPKPFTQILELFPGMSRTTLKDLLHLTSANGLRETTIRGAEALD